MPPRACLDEGVTRVLAVANQKGGVAKTTTVASLGAARVVFIATAAVADYRPAEVSSGKLTKEAGGLESIELVFWGMA